MNIFRTMGVVITLSVVRRDIFDERGHLLAARGVVLTPRLQRLLHLRNVFTAVWSDDNQDDELLLHGQTSGETTSPVLNAPLPILRTACQEVVDAQRWIQEHSCLRFHLAVLMDHIGWVYGHSLNVATLTAIIALRMGLERSQRIELIAGALLHDVGNIFVPAEILSKPGELSIDERSAVSRHASLGERMLTRTGVPFRIACIAGQHHERWDGSGYPRRLRGPEIDLGAQIVGLADVFDALTSVRPHRGAACFTDAQHYLLSRKNTDFHSAIINLLLRQN